METASTYFTRRARQERTSALEAASAEARTAHLEMAFRLVTIATQPALWGQNAATPNGHNDNAHKTGDALREAFPLPAADDFQHLLNAVDRTTDQS
jgi:hypothetical protein